ncbi:MAG: hypothetical protein LWX83_15890 [Anaerolineae bacterium]|nr:hypothetical protein [Anaerolineae bacterium]
MSQKIIQFLGFILTGLLFLLPVKPVRADIAPPAGAPGSSIIPGQNTRVRMLAENVLMVLKPGPSGTYVAEVSADFAMKNMGENDEKMMVRFPLEDVSGIGDGFLGHPTVKNFKVQVNRQSVAVNNTREPYQDNSPAIAWANFEAAFPRGKEVFIKVTYTTDLQSDNHPTLKYIIGTGSGWHQSIGSATLTVRLPYAAGPANTGWYQPADPILIGKEVRWHWYDYEPNQNEVVELSLVNPIFWNRILELEAQTGNEPDNINAAVKLSQLYINAASEKHGCMDNNAAGSLAEIAIQQALALHPSDVNLHLQLAEVYQWQLDCQDATSLSNRDRLEALKAEIQTVLQLAPNNQRAIEINGELNSIKSAPALP